ncbi:hypothetical protein HRH25_06085 [Flavisolibacter sp. BT320]|nr:hypothetical protein [Flavisolibacter longurius]
MQQNVGRSPVYKPVILLLVLLSAIALKYGLTSHPGWYNLLYVTVPLLIAANLYPLVKGWKHPRLKRLKPFTINS